jgi:hypothetical protein
MASANEGPTPAYKWLEIVAGCVALLGVGVSRFGPPAGTAKWWGLFLMYAGFTIGIISLAMRAKGNTLRLTGFTIALGFFAACTFFWLNYLQPVRPPAAPLDAKAAQRLQMTLQGKEVTDAALKEKLAGREDLRFLMLNNTKVTDAALKEVGLLKELRYLHLDNTDITDAGLKELAGLKKLRDLALNGTNVTDAGLTELAAVPSLERVRAHRTKVTAVGVAALQKELPKCAIHTDDHDPDREK